MKYINLFKKALIEKKNKKKKIKMKIKKKIINIYFLCYQVLIIYLNF